MWHSRWLEESSKQKEALPVFSNQAKRGREKEWIWQSFPAHTLEFISSLSPLLSTDTQSCCVCLLAFIVDKDEPSCIGICYFAFPCSEKETETHLLIALGCPKGKHSSPWLRCEKELIVCISSELPRQEHDNVWYFSVIY